MYCVQRKELEDKDEQEKEDKGTEMKQYVLQIPLKVLTHYAE